MERSTSSTGRREPPLDRQVIARAQRGDEAAFAVLALERADRLHAIAQHILRDRDLAADAAQHALVEIWRRLPQLREIDRFEAWTYRIVVRAAYAEHRRRAAWRVGPGAVLDADAGHDVARGVADRDELDRSFAKLSVEHRAALVLKHVAGLGDAEIADVLGVPEGTVRSRLHYATQQLRAAIEAGRRTPAGSAR